MLGNSCLKICQNMISLWQSSSHKLVKWLPQSLTVWGGLISAKWSSLCKVTHTYSVLISNINHFFFTNEQVKIDIDALKAYNLLWKGQGEASEVETPTSMLSFDTKTCNLPSFY